MTRKQWRIIIRICLFTVLLVLSPFLPGPGFLSKPTNIIFSLAQVGSILGLLFIPVGLVRTYNQRQKLDKELKPLLLWILPMLTFIISMWGAELAREMSRAIAINNADKLITAIEDYKKKYTHYPDDTSELIPEFVKSIPAPWIMGISGYDYERKKDSFTLTFSQNVIIGFNFEVVVYDPTGNHTPEGKLATLYETGNDKWKYYIYD